MLCCVGCVGNWDRNGALLSIPGASPHGDVPLCHSLAQHPPAFILYLTWMSLRGPLFPPPLALALAECGGDSTIPLYGTRAPLPDRPTTLGDGGQPAPRRFCRAAMHAGTSWRPELEGPSIYYSSCSLSSGSSLSLLLFPLPSHGLSQFLRSSTELRETRLRISGALLFYATALHRDALLGTFRHRADATPQPGHFYVVDFVPTHVHQLRNGFSWNF